MWWIKTSKSYTDRVKIIVPKTKNYLFFSICFSSHLCYCTHRCCCCCCCSQSSESQTGHRCSPLSHQRAPSTRLEHPSANGKNRYSYPLHSKFSHLTKYLKIAVFFIYQALTVDFFYAAMSELLSHCPLKHSCGLLWAHMKYLTQSQLSHLLHCPWHHFKGMLFLNFSIPNHQLQYTPPLRAIQSIFELHNKRKTAQCPTIPHNIIFPTRCSAAPCLPTQVLAKTELEVFLRGETAVGSLRSPAWF